MATVYSLHPVTPQSRKVEEIRDALRRGAIMLYPTDTVYAIGCDLNAKSAIERVRQIKRLSNDKPLTFLCPSLSNISHYAHVSDTAYRLMRRLIPGAYTFLLPATKLVPRLVMDLKRKTTGIRVPDHPICQALLASLGNPIISTTAYQLNADEAGVEASTTKVDLFNSLEKLVDILIDDDLELGYQVSTILDLTGDEPVLVRQGVGWETAADWVDRTRSAT